nr:acyl carrier protein [Rhodococcus jostii]
MQRSPGSREVVAFSAVAEIIVAVTGIERSHLTPQTSLVEHLGIEDMSTMVEIAAQIEDAFGVTIPDDKLFGMRTLGDYMAYLKLVAEEAIAEPADEAIADPLGADVSWWNSES